VTPRTMESWIVLDSGDDEAGVRESDDDDDDDFRVVPSRPAVPEVKDRDDGDGEGNGEGPDAPSKKDGGSSKKEEDGEDVKNEDANDEDAKNEDAKNEDAKNEDADNEPSEDFDSDEDEDDMPLVKIAARREARAAKLDPERLLREADPEVASPEVAALRAHWQLAVVLDFFSVFNTELLEKPFDAADLESALVDPCADPHLWGFIVNTQVELLNGCGFRVENGELFRRRKRRHTDKDHGLMIRDNSWAWVTSRVICEWWRTLTGKRSNEASKPPFAPPMRARAEEEDKVHRNKFKPFNAFAKAERSTIKAEHPDIAKREVDLHLAVRWRRLPDAERREYDPSYDPELVDDNEFTERWYADEMTPSQRLMTLWGLCELRLMIGLDLLGPHDVGYEAGLKEPPAKFRPTPIGADDKGNEYWLRTDSLYRSGEPTYCLMDSVDVPLPVEPPPYYNRDSGTWKDQDEEDYTQLPCMQCGRMQYDEKEIEHKFLLCDVCVNGGHARCMGVSVIPGGDTAWNCPVCDGQARIKAAKEAAAEMELKKVRDDLAEKAEKERAERERVERERVERENAAARRIQTSVRAWLRGKVEAKRSERKKAEKAAAERIQASWRAFMSRKAETENAERAKLEHVENGAEVVENPSTRNVPDVIDLTAEPDEDEHQRLIGESQAHVRQQQQDGRWKRNPANPETFTADPGVRYKFMSFTEVAREHEKEFWRALFQFNTQVLKKADGKINPGLVCYNVPNPWQPMKPIQHFYQVNLYKMWFEASRLGGDIRVTENGWWGMVSRSCLPELNQFDPATFQICFQKYQETLKAFDVAFMMIDDAYKVEIGMSSNQHAYTKWQTWAYLRIKEGKFDEVRQTVQKWREQPFYTENQTSRLMRQFSLFRKLRRISSNFIGDGFSDFTKAIKLINAKIAEMQRIKNEMKAAPPKAEHHGPSRFTSDSTTVHPDSTTPGLGKVDPDLVKIYKTWSEESCEPPEPYVPPGPFHMPPPPTAGSWECIATTPAQMAQVAESLRDLDGSTEGNPGTARRLRLSEVIKLVASRLAVSQELARQDAERAARKLARIEEEKRLKREMREEEERARNEKRRLKAVADRERAQSLNQARASNRKTQTSEMFAQTSGRFMRERKQVNYDERAHDRKLAEAIEERPTGHARFDRAARFERRDHEGARDTRTRKPVNYDEDALNRKLDEAIEEGTASRVRDPHASEDASEESDGGGGGEEDDGLGTDSSEDDETYWRTWERNRAASVQKALAGQTGVRIESPAPSPMKPSRTAAAETHPVETAASPQRPASGLKMSRKAAALSQSSESSDENDDDDDESDYEEELGIVLAGGRRRKRRRRHVSISILADCSDSPAWRRVLASRAKLDETEDADEEEETKEEEETPTTENEEEEESEESEERMRERREREAEEERKRREKAAADRARLDKVAWEAEEEAPEEADKVFRLDPYSDITPNQLFCKVVRRKILLAYPRLSPKSVNVLLSNLWSKTLNGDERRTFTRIVAEAKEREMDRLGREKRNRGKETAAAFEADEEDEDEEDGSDDDYKGSSDCD